MQQHSTSFRIDEQTHGIVEETAEKSNSSAKAVYETAIKRNVRTLQKLASGGKTARDLIILLDNIRGITATAPEDDARAYILNGELSDSHPRIDLSPEHLEALSSLKLETGLSRSELIRRCVFRQLNHLVHQQDLIEGWRRDEIVSTWKECKAGLRRSKLQCHDILQRRFVDEPETIGKIEADPPGFERFAEEYVTRFHQSACYTHLVEARGERTFTDVENIIMEHTNHTLEGEPGETGFLDNFLREIDE